MGFLPLLRVNLIALNILSLKEWLLASIHLYKVDSSCWKGYWSASVEISLNTLVSLLMQDCA